MTGRTIGRSLRTLASLRPTQVVARAPHLLLARLLRDLPAGHGPASRAFPAPAPSGLVAFANAERSRFLRRREKLPAGSLLRAYEEQYGLDLGAEADGPHPDWTHSCAVRAFPASVRARRIAVAIRCGRRDLDRELARAARAVLTQVELHLLGNHLLENGLGLAAAGAVGTGTEADLWWTVGRHLLDWQLPEQFLADGGHFERSASYHLALTAGICEVVALAQAGGRAVPQRWLDVAGRALGWATTIRAPDGSYPLFNDASLDAAPSIDQVLALARACALGSVVPAWTQTGSSALLDLRATGWLVLSTPSAWMCLDVGPDGAAYQGGHVHADALGFELWVEGVRAVVDFGVSSYARDAARDETRATRSHNTVTVAGQNSSEVWAAFRVGRRARSSLLAVETHGDRMAVGCSHDGYRWLPGRPEHHRELVLEPRSLTVHDRMHSAVPHASASRLRLALPERVQWEGRSVMASADRWHAEFATPLAARVLCQPVEPGLGARWTLRW